MAKRDFSGAIENTLMGRGRKTASVTKTEEKEKKQENAVQKSNDIPIQTIKTEDDGQKQDAVINSPSDKDEIKNIDIPHDIQSEPVEEPQTAAITNITSHTEVVPAEKVFSELVLVGSEQKKNVGGRPKKKIVPHKKITVDLPEDMVDQVTNYAIKDYGDNLTTYIRRLITKDLRENLEYYQKRAASIEADEWN